MLGSLLALIVALDLLDNMIKWAKESTFLLQSGKYKVLQFVGKYDYDSIKIDNEVKK